MNVFCLSRFETEFNKLIRKPSYKNLPELLCKHFAGKAIEDIQSGTLLNANSEIPFIKKRLGGSGGYRLCYYVIVLNGNVFLTGVHAKSGSMGFSNYSDAAYKKMKDDFAEAIKSSNYKKVVFDTKKKRISFS